ncbi:MAG: dihydrolipoyl dehydrogenase [Deltaproteobacteria bacterium]|nr:dihydrolipoyl dehydrogenase [Deltaproteobacteria bacterium]MBW2137632.1 dihydrolipoyl dehydrogenase [Deltaproteobacteria bacterium]
MATRVVIIGAGPGGYVAAVRAAQMGTEVTVVEQDKVGGTCLNWGCIPSKIMARCAEITDLVKDAGHWGIGIEASRAPDLEALARRERTVIQGQAEGIMKLFKRHGISYAVGRGYIQDSGLVTVYGEDGENQEIPWDSLILATGSRPMELPRIPFDGKRVISSNEALFLQEVPKSVLIIGAGAIGCEFAFIFSAMGSAVTLVEILPNILPIPSVDDECRKVIQREMKKRKIQFLLGNEVKGLEDRGEKLRVTIGPSHGKSKTRSRKDEGRTLEVERVLVCIGRAPNSAHLGLENLGVKTDARGWIIANDRMETNVPGVYAIGDLLGPSKVMLAHVASAEGRVAAENCAGGSNFMKYDVIPHVIFTRPEVACVGLTEKQALEMGIDIDTRTVLFRSLGKAHVTGEISGLAKVLWDTESKRILGLHLVGPQAGDLIAEATLALRKGLTLRDLADTIHAHPTFSEIMAELAFKALGRPVHA